MNKSDLRKWVRNVRAEIPEARRQIDAEKIAIAAGSVIQKIMGSGRYRNGEQIIVGTYYPYGGEIVPPHDIPNVQMALPVIRNKTTLEFYPWSIGEPLAKRDFDIPIPDTRGLSEVFPDIILVPLVACDVAGSRIGQGAGHYDRYIASREVRPILIGVCFDEQIVTDGIVAEPHDQALDLIITPTQVIEVA